MAEVVWRDNVFLERRAVVRHWPEEKGRAAEDQIRRSLPARLRKRFGSPRFHRALSGLL
jgi:hypothetical protein